MEITPVGDAVNVDDKNLVLSANRLVDSALILVKKQTHALVDCPYSFLHADAQLFGLSNQKPSQAALI
jgi:hypothetical protein